MENLSTIAKKPEVLILVLLELSLWARIPIDVDETSGLS